MFLSNFFKVSVLILGLITLTISALFNTTHAANWTASTNNPYRSNIRAEYLPRIDGVVLRILAKGKDLQVSIYPTYVSNVSKGITTLGAKPEYSGNPEITSIIKYISFELDGVSRNLASNDSFFEELMQVIDGTSGGDAGGRIASTGTVSTRGTATTSTAAAASTTGTPTPATIPTSTTFELSKTQASMSEEISFNYAVTDDRTCTISTNSTNTTSRLLMNITAGTSGTWKYTLLPQDASNGVIVLNMSCTNGTIKNRNITVQWVVNIGAPTPASALALPTTPFYMVAKTSTDGKNVLNFKIDKSYGYKGCMMTVGDEGGITIIPGSTSYSVGNGNTMGLWSSLKADGSWEWSVFVGDLTGFVNLYCQKADLKTNAQGQLVLNVTSMERLIPATRINALFNAPLTNMTITAIPWQNAPIINFVRDAGGVKDNFIMNNDRKYGANWTTINITSLIYSCNNGPTGFKDSVQPLQMSGNYNTYQQLIAAGWTPGLYDCTITGTGPGGTISVKDTFRIQ